MSKLDSHFPIYAKMGGALAVGEFLSRTQDKPVTVAAQRMWFTYGHIPAKYVIVLTKECRRRRIKTVDSDFISENGD